MGFHTEKFDRITRLQDLQDKMLGLNWGQFGQDYRIAGFTGLALK